MGRIKKIIFWTIPDGILSCFRSNNLPRDTPYKESLGESAGPQPDVPLSGLGCLLSFIKCRVNTYTIKLYPDAQVSYVNMACLDIESKLVFLTELFQDIKRLGDKRHAMFSTESCPDAYRNPNSMGTLSGLIPHRVMPRRCQKPEKHRNADRSGF